MEERVKFNVRETLNGWQALFSIDHQTFSMQEYLNEDHEGEEMTAEKHAWWLVDMMKIAFNRLR